MPQEVKQLIGALNLDDPRETIGKGAHSDSRNIEFTGTPPNRRVRLVSGNVVKTNALLPVTGTNKTILERYDPLNKCIYFFNFNSTGKHGIYRFNTIPETFQRLVEVGINTNGDVLGFTADKLYNFDIIYGDSAQGDILYWIDSLARPSKINVTRALTGGYGTIQRSFLDVAKEPADIPPYVIYENDAANTVNNLRKKLFKVKVRYVFDDHDKAVTSSQSVLPLPQSAFDQAVDTDATRNCRLAITYQTGAANVKKIELLVASSLGNQFSNFFLIASIDKAVSSIPDNDIATYLFYNDQGYDDIDVNESDQLFDYVPQLGTSQTLINGNTVAYGNITEGYPNLMNFSFGGNSSAITPGETPWYSGTTWSNLIASQSGKSGFGTGTIHIVVRGIVFAVFSLDTYIVTMTDGSTIQYTVTAGDDAAAVIAGLRADAISKGYTIVSSGNNDLYVSKVSISLARANISSTYIYNSVMNTSFFAYDWSSRHGWGLVYFDDKGRTNGVVYAAGFTVNSSPYTEGTAPNDKPLFNASIYHQPPDWAYYYQWVRTKDLSKSKIQQWVSDRTFKDNSVVAGKAQYAYISIESLNQFVQENPGSPLGYGFVSGDRIKFFKRYNGDGSTAFLYYNTKDFEIVASLVNPTVNGEVKSGQFIKIVLPPTDGSFDFGSGFNNYFIEMYTPAQSVANGLNLYYEYGERYAIGNPTLGTRFHQGMLQNQTSNYSQPATFEFTKGDFFIRLRAVQVGNVYNFNITSGTLTAGRILFGLDFIDSTFADSNVVAQSVALSNVSGNSPSGGFNPGSDARWHLSATTNTTFLLNTTIILSFTDQGNTGIPWRVFIKNKFGEEFNIVEPFSPGDGGTFTFPVTFPITLENDRIFLVAEGGERPITVLASTLTYTNNDHVISQRMIDQNFSDYFQSAVNSNGRTFVFDENANRVTFPAMYRWSLAYQEDTNINQANRFYPQNFDEVNRGFGPIMAMKVWDRMLTFFQERKCGQTGVFQKTISDSGGGNDILTSTDNIVTSNNVNYYAGDYGVGNQAASIVQSGYMYYFIDPIKCKILRLSKDGLVDLTELYKVQTWAGQNFPKYLNPGTYAFGGSQKVLGVFNVRPDNVDEYLILAQGTSLVPGESMAFEEAYNSFYSKLDIDCDGMVCAETSLFYFIGGVLYKQSASAPKNTFFGVLKEASINLPFNENIVVKKVFNAVGYMSNATWNSNVKGDVETNSINSQTGLSQQSLIMAQDYDVFESPKRYAAFNFDMNSNADQITGLWEGDKLTGELVGVKLKITSSVDTYLYAPFIQYQVDNRNP